LRRFSSEILFFEFAGLRFEFVLFQFIRMGQSDGGQTTVPAKPYKSKGRESTIAKGKNKPAPPPKEKPKEPSGSGGAGSSKRGPSKKKMSRVATGTRERLDAETLI
jgi:hypothetical protein